MIAKNLGIQLNTVEGFAAVVTVEKMIKQLKTARTHIIAGIVINKGTYHNQEIV